MQSKVVARSCSSAAAPFSTAVICTPAASVPGIVMELGERGTRAAVVISAGMGALDQHGVPLSQRMLDAADRRRADDHAFSAELGGGDRDDVAAALGRRP